MRNAKNCTGGRRPRKARLGEYLILDMLRRGPLSVAQLWHRLEEPNERRVYRIIQECVSQGWVSQTTGDRYALAAAGLAAGWRFAEEVADGLTDTTA